jgi:hypothetical protein
MAEMLDFAWDVAESGYEWVRKSDHGYLRVADDDPGQRSDFLLPSHQHQSLIRVNKDNLLHQLGKGRERIIRAPGKLLENGEGIEAVVDEFCLKQTVPSSLEKTLFLKLAHTSPTRAHIKAFADAYGLLWHGLDDDNPWEGLWWGDGGCDTIPPAFDLWVQNILILRFAITLWNLARNEDIHGLSSYIHWYRPSEAWIEFPCYTSRCDLNEVWDINTLCVDGHIHPARGQRVPILHVKHRIDALEFDPAIYGTCALGDLLAPAWAYVLALVNAHCVKNFSLVMSSPASRQKPQWRVKPDSLLSYLWYQFSCAIHANTIYQACPACGCWLELTPGVNRKDRVFCSNVCRMRAYRQRKTRTKKLA